MSKVFKGVKKVFKKVFKVIKKVVPIVLAAAAIYFTAGAALGVGSAAGGWGAMGAKIGGVFGEGVLASTVTGAVTSAGYGAAIGGGVSAAIRLFSLFPEGVSFGVLIGNTFASLLDEWFPAAKGKSKKKPVAAKPAIPANHGSMGNQAYRQYSTATYIFCFAPYAWGNTSSLHEKYLRHKPCPTR